MDYFSELTFDSGSIRPEEYLYLVEFIKRNGFKSILEFGPGVSTYAFLENNCDVYTFEHNPMWFNSYRREFVNFDNVHVSEYDAENETLYLPQIKEKTFDMAFIDAPPGGRDLARLKTCSAASKYTGVFILHDCGRADEKAILNVFERKGWKSEIVSFGRGFGICCRKEVRIQKILFEGLSGEVRQLRRKNSRGGKTEFGCAVSNPIKRDQHG